MKITVLGESVAMEGTRLIRKQVKVFTYEDNVPLLFVEGQGYRGGKKIYHDIKVVIDRIISKTFEGEETDDYVEVDLNNQLKTV